MPGSQLRRSHQPPRSPAAARLDAAPHDVRHGRPCRASSIAAMANGARACVAARVLARGALLSSRRPALRAVPHYRNGGSRPIAPGGEGRRAGVGQSSAADACAAATPAATTAHSSAIGGGWSTHHLTEFLAAVSAAADEVARAASRSSAASAFEADFGALRPRRRSRCAQCTRATLRTRCSRRWLPVSAPSSS